MKSLMCLIPNFFDATSFYRAAGPLGRLRQQCMGLQLNFVNEWNWATIHMSDAMFIQRPYSSKHMQVVEMAKEQGKKIWLDYDDDLFTVPTDNPAHKIYADSETQKTVAKCIAMADVVTVTTEHLKKQFQKGNGLNKNIVVIPNAMDFEMFPYRQKTLNPRNPVMLWRGSATHHRDVVQFSKQIIEVGNNQAYGSWMWRFVGDNLWFVTDYMPHKQVIWSQSLDVMEYNRHIYDICPKAIMVPLHDSVFNKSKSNIAWMEGMFSGAVCIGPDWDEWKKPGILNYRDAKSFQHILEGVMSGEIETEVEAQRGWDYIKENLDLRKVNELRIKVIEELVGGAIR